MLNEDHKENDCFMISVLGTQMSPFTVDYEYEKVMLH